MTSYVKETLQKFQRPTPTKPYHSHHQWTAPIYRSTAPELAHPSDDYPSLNIYEAINFQHALRKFLYYARTFDTTMLVTLNSIAAEQLEKSRKIEKSDVPYQLCI